MKNEAQGTAAAQVGNANSNEPGAFARIPRREGEAIWVTAAEFKGAWYVSARTHWRNPAGEWCPTRKGVTLPAEQLDALIDGLKRARLELEQVEALDRAA